jgi:lipopolysaccharide heptosyltransferase II
MPNPSANDPIAAPACPTEAQRLPGRVSVSMKRLQAADALLGRLACWGLKPLARLLRRRPEGDLGQPQRVLLVKFWGIGSLQLLTPSVRCLRERHGGAALELLTLKQNAAYAEGLGVFDQVHTLDLERASWPRLALRILRLMYAARKARFAAAYDFEFFTRFSAVVTLMTGAPISHGFDAPSVWRGGFHTVRVPFNRYWHVARNFRNLAGGENGEEIRPADLAHFEIKEQHRSELDECFQRFNFANSGPLVVLNPNAGSLSLERRWPTTHFAQLGTRLAIERGARLVLIGAPSERAWTSEVAAKLTALNPERVLNLAGQLSIGGLHALLEVADLFVTNDSGPMHLAAALGTPTLGLFGPETPLMYGPLGERAEGLYRPPACSPCINVHENKVASCVRGRPECLTNLSVEHVFARASARLERGSLPFYLPRLPARIAIEPSPSAESGGLLAEGGRR